MDQYKPPPMDIKGAYAYEYRQNLFVNGVFRIALGQESSSFYDSEAGRDTWQEKSALVLFRDGCNVIGQTPTLGNTDCTEACKLQPFKDLATLSNCMVYPVISNLMAVGNLTKDAMSMAKTSGIRPANEFNSSGIIQQMKDCFDDICQTKNCRTLCPATDTAHSNWTNVPFGSEDLSSPYSCYKDICYDLDTDVDQDIGGIGTSISFLMQIMILIISYLALRFFDSWVYRILVTIFWFGGSFYPRQKARYFQERLRKSQQHAALQTAFLEFQKAQCYVLMAFQIAAILALLTRNNAQLIDSTNMSQLQANLSQLDYIGRDGLFTIMFGLLCLHVERLSSWFLLVLSTLTVGLSMTVLHLVKAIDLDPSNVDLGEPSPKCPGATTNLISLCFSSGKGSAFTQVRTNIEQYVLAGDTTYQGSSGSRHKIGDAPLPNIDNFRHYEPLAYIALLAFALDIWKFKRTINGTEEEANIYRHALRHFFAWRKPPLIVRALIRGLGSFLVMALNLSFAVLLMIFFIEIYLASMAAGGTKWSFGQVLSVAVWVPSLIEFVYLSFYGMVRGMKYRVPQPYQVIRRRTTNLRQD